MSSIGLISENDNSTVLAEYTGLNRVATSFQSEDALEKELIKTLVEQGYERLNINSEDELILNNSNYFKIKNDINDILTSDIFKDALKRVKNV